VNGYTKIWRKNEMEAMNCVLKYTWRRILPLVTLPTHRLTAAHHWTIPWTGWIQLSLHAMLNIAILSSPRSSIQVFHQTFVQLSHACCMPRPSHPSWLHHLNPPNWFSSMDQATSKRWPCFEHINSGYFIRVRIAVLFARFSLTSCQLRSAI
jgi:hypothetical protein